MERETINYTCDYGNHGSRIIEGLNVFQRRPSEQCIKMRMAVEEINKKLGKYRKDYEDKMDYIFDVCLRHNVNPEHILKIITGWK